MSRRPRAIRVTLTLWYVAVMVVVLGVYALTVFTFVRRNLYSSLDERLRNDVDWAVATADMNTDGTPRWFEDDRGGGMYSFWMQVRRVPDGLVIFRTGVADRNPLRGAAQSLELSRSQIVTFTSDDGEPVRLLTSPQKIADTNVVIQVARNESDLRDELRRLVVIFAFGLPLGVVVAGVGGYLLARRAFTPVERMAERARTITAERLSERLPVDNPDDELGHLATVVNETLGRLESSFEQMRRFTADVSHELRTPLTAIRTVGEVGLRERRDASGYRGVVSSMLEEVDRLRGLVDRLLVLSRAESGQIRLNREPIDLADLAEEVIAQLGVLAEEKGQALAVSKSAVWGLADRSVLRQAILNLVDNAIKYTPAGGHIDVSLWSAGSSAVIEVHDDGPGIRTELRASLFDRFSRPAGHGASGAGLGLSIAKWAVEANGGRLVFEPRPGSGSSFRITLPCAEPGASSALQRKMA